MRKLSLGILAHADAGKTTLSEALLYLTGTIRKAGRVDHKDAFLDTFDVEKERGITVYSKEAVLSFPGHRVFLLDTPGHADFAAETERVLSVLDAVIMVVSASEGIQSHTETLMSLSERYGLPVFLFINKADQPGADTEAVIDQMQKRFGNAVIDFRQTDNEKWFEDTASVSEDILDEYLESGTVPDDLVRKAIESRLIMPVVSGSALKMEGVETLIEVVDRFAPVKEYPDEFGARVFKISREKGTRYTHLKVTGGKLKIRDEVIGTDDEGNQLREKISEMIMPNGSNRIRIQEAEAGDVVMVSGLTHSCQGQGLGNCPDAREPYIEPVLTYSLLLPKGTDITKMYMSLLEIEDEEPELKVSMRDVLKGEISAEGDHDRKEIQISFMGDIQTEILQGLIFERTGINVSFGDGHILYKETIRNTVEGVGHYEPLRHYAEVHLKLEPGEKGSGLVFLTECPQDSLSSNWQRLILTHLKEKNHVGVLTGSPITDMKITLVAGKAHLKHTEGGDFRQATYRAVRQGLMQADSELLEPWYSFRIEIPAELTGRIMTDLERKYARGTELSQNGTTSVLTGYAPVSEMRNYQSDINASTSGKGRVTLRFFDYETCHNKDAILTLSGYDPEKDRGNPAYSVFCAHGAGYPVPWNEVKDHMHLPPAVVTE